MIEQTKFERFLENLKRILIHILHWTWCLPQTLVGLGFYVYLNIKKSINKERYGTYNEAEIYCTYLTRGSISLGNRVFLCDSHWDDDNVIRHELGHYKQSLILGPLYLFVIGIPSVLWCNVFWPRKMKKWKEMKVFSESINEHLKLKLNVPPKPSYYDFYTEKWANKLMGLELK